MGIMMDSDNLVVNEDHDVSLPHGEKLQRALDKNIAVRASTSLDSIQSYEEMKADKHFQLPLNIRHINKARFTGLLRAGSGLCCYFQDALG